MGVQRHKVFVSFHHNQNDEYYKDQLTEMQFFNYEKLKYEFVFENYSVSDGDIDENLNDERIRVKIRDEYIKDANVLILLCGEETKNRKHIDWELHAAMFNTEKNPRLGILVITLPNVHQALRVSSEDEKNIIECGREIKCYTRKDYEENFPYMPSRVIDNLVKDIDISVINWYSIQEKPDVLMKFIDNAFKRRKSISYDNSAPLRKHNS